MVHTLGVVATSARPRFKCGACGAAFAHRRAAQQHMHAAPACHAATLIYVRATQPPHNTPPDNGTDNNDSSHCRNDNDTAPGGGGVCAPRAGGGSDQVQKTASGGNADSAADALVETHACAPDGGAASPGSWASGAGIAAWQATEGGGTATHTSCGGGTSGGTSVGLDGTGGGGTSSGFGGGVLRLQVGHRDDRAGGLGGAHSEEGCGQGVTCGVCGLWFATREEEGGHWGWLAPREEQRQCGQCRRWFGSARALEQHTAACRVKHRVST